MCNENSGEYLSFDLNEWELVKIAKGANKGDNPIITNNGTVYVDRTRTGEDVRVLIRKQKIPVKSCDEED